MSTGKKLAKKADLSLSTNAIVILILAITILGLGLTFVRGLFKQAESKILEVTSSTELSSPPTRDNPITIAPSQITLRQKEQGKAVLAFLNNANTEKKCQLIIKTDTGTEVMTDGSSSSGNVKGVVIYNNKLSSTPIKVDGINVWTLAVDGSKVTVSSGYPSATHVLTANMCCATSTATSCNLATDSQFTRDLIITVTP